MIIKKITNNFRINSYLPVLKISEHAKNKKLLVPFKQSIITLKKIYNL